MPHLLTRVIAGVLLATTVACEPATSNASTLYRNAFLGHPVTCNAEPFVDTMPVPTELGSRLDCLGWYEWTDARDLQLDVIRYGTIVELTPLRHLDVGRDIPGQPYSTRSIIANVDRVLRGAAPLGTHEMTVTLGIGADPAKRQRRQRAFGNPTDENSARRRGGYTNLVFERSRGLLFIPRERVDDPIFLGCLGGHFAIPDAFRPRLIEDYELLARLLAVRPAESFEHEPPTSPLLEPLVGSAGSTVGYFIAEYFGWRTSLELLDRTMLHDDTISPFEIGLVEGMIRMEVLHRLRHYPAPAWRDVDMAAVGAKLVDWAILRIPDLPPKPHSLRRDTMTDRQRCVAAWIITYQHAMAPALARAHLASTDDAIDFAKTFIPTLHARSIATGGYTASLDELERLLRGDAPQVPARPPNWFTTPGVCPHLDGESVSRTPFLPWSREAFGTGASGY